MSDEKNRLIDAVAKLTALTQQGQLRWTVETYYEEQGGVLGPPYYAEYGDRRLRLQKRRESVSPRRNYEPEYTERPVLEFVDQQGASLWKFPALDGIEHLFSAVKYQTAGVEDFLSGLLDEP